jgi:hypothetical protein
VRISTSASAKHFERHSRFLEGLRKGSASRAPFSLEECRTLLQCLDKTSSQIISNSTAPSFNSVFVASTARTHLIYWILLYAGMYVSKYPNTVNSSFFFMFPLSISAYHCKITEYGARTYSEYNSRSSHVQAHSIWFTALAFLCFGVPFSHR